MTTNTPTGPVNKANVVTMSGVPQRRNGAGLPAVTAEEIVDAAVRLTSDCGLENWTLRQLAAEIGASPAVVYHHVGDREAVVALVIERIMLEVEPPPESLPWREWFSTMLHNHRKILRTYPGTAYRFALHGPPVSTAAATIDLGVRLLQEAGFGAESVLAYNVLMTTACQYVAMESSLDRATPSTTNPYLAYRGRTDMPGMAAVGEFVARLVSGPEMLEQFSDEVFCYAIERCLDGLERRLTDLAR